MSRVQIIEATKPLYATNTWDPNRRKRVCAYARVSTELEEQQSSYERQIEYYSRYIRQNPEWEFAGIYADEGISATSIKHREGFKIMIADAKAGKIDLILCKSVSRFARNTADSIRIVNELKEYGVEVQFEKENISSFEGRSEASFGIMSTLAQEESRSLAANVSWAYEKKARAGDVYMNCANFLGYENDANGDPVIIEEEAKVVRKIYKMYIDGKTPTYIARYLTERHIPTPAHKDVWSAATIRSILTNEKYMGDVLTSKYYTTSYLDKKRRKNTGQKFQAYIENHHPAIIDKETFNYVQSLIKERSTANQKSANRSALSGKLYCANCGKKLTHRVWNCRGKIKYDIWVCGNKYNYDNYEQCQLVNYRQDIIELGYVHAVKQLLADRSHYTAKYGQKMVDIQEDLGKSDAKSNIAKLYKQAEDSYNKLHQLSAMIGDFEEDNSLVQEMQHTLNKINENISNINKINNKNQKISGSIYSINKIMDMLSHTENIDTFNGELFRSTIDKVIVADEYITYRFVGDVEITIPTTVLKGEKYA